MLEGHEHAFQHFGGVPAQIVVDDAQPVVLRHAREAETWRHRVVWHPTYADFAAFYGFTPWAHWQYGRRRRERSSPG